MTFQSGDAHIVTKPETVTHMSSGPVMSEHSGVGRATIVPRGLMPEHSGSRVVPVKGKMGLTNRNSPGRASEE